MASRTWLGDQLRNAELGQIIFEEASGMSDSNRVRCLARLVARRCGDGRRFVVSIAPLGEHPGFFIERVR